MAFKRLTANEVEERFCLTPKQLDKMEEEAAAGILHGEPRGEIVHGRPLLFGEEMRQVGFKEPLSKVRAIDKRAKELGMGRSEYLRSLVDADLSSANVA